MVVSGLQTVALPERQEAEQVKDVKICIGSDEDGQD